VRTFSLGELAKLLGGAVVGDASIALEGVNELELAGPRELAYFSNAVYAQAFKDSRAGAVVVEAAVAAKHPNRTLLVAPNAPLAFARASRLFHPQAPPAPFVSPHAVIDPAAFVDPLARIEPQAFIGPDARVGARAWVMPFAYVGEGARIGDDVVLGPGSVVMDHCELGSGARLQPGAVIGADGFGYVLDLEEGAHLKIPQIGTVVVEEQVEIGANSCVDRATLGVTRVGAGSKLDNLVQVGHNVQLGRMCILCGQVGLAGSSRFGDGVMLGGQAGVKDHIIMGDGAQLAAQAGLGHDVPAGEAWGGSPAMPAGQWLRSWAQYKELGTLRSEVKRLARELEDLRQRMGSL
jgi:UDP-3-O-[3-hydroxymyristoyl] glucosamine N-acyltransferase